MYKKLVSLVLIIASSTCVQGKTLQQKEDIIKLEKALVGHIKRNKAGKFSIQGKVIDEKGKPLDNVRVTITKSISRGFMESESYRHYETINGNFLFDEHGCNALYLDFYKKDYFVVHKYYDISMKQQENISVNDSLVTAKNQIIVLRAFGKLAKLKKADEKFYLNPVTKEQDIMDLIDFQKKEVNDVENIITKKYFYLNVKCDANGEPLMIFDTRTKKMVPEKIFLNYISNNRADGIIIAHNAKDITYLKIAPESGYAKEPIPLVLNIHSDANIFFYYKNGNTYGKVWIQQTAYISGKVESILIIKENVEKDPKEKRNLRSLKW